MYWTRGIYSDMVSDKLAYIATGWLNGAFCINKLTDHQEHQVSSPSCLRGGAGRFTNVLEDDPMV